MTGAVWSSGLQSAFVMHQPKGGRWVTPLKGLYRYVQPFGFSSALVIHVNRVSNLAILVMNRVWFLHSCLELGFFRRSYFFIIIDKTRTVVNRTTNFCSDINRVRIFVRNQVRDLGSGRHTGLQEALTHPRWVGLTGNLTFKNHKVTQFTTFGFATVVFIVSLKLNLFTHSSTVN